MKAKTDKVVRSWKASPEDVRVLRSLEKAKVENSESARVRAGLRLLAEKNKVPA